MDFMRAKKNSNIQVAVRKEHVERIVEKKKPAPLPSKIELERQRERQRTREASATSARPSPSTARSSYSPAGDRNGHANGNGRKRKAVEREQRSRGLSSSPETEGEGNSTPARENAVKNKKARIVDKNRRLKSRVAFGSEGGSEDRQSFAMIHAADIASPARATNRDGYREDMVIRLQYPSNSQKERYALRFRNGEIDPLVDILECARLVTKVYLTEEQALPFNPDTGILRQLERARNLLSKDAKNEALQKGFKEAVDGYNAEVKKLVKSGDLAKNLDSMHQLDFDMVKHVMTQVYDRTVAPDVESLRDYKAGSDNVYGELLTPFVFRILTDANLKSDQVFVDLGSGVGNVVLQAALQFGCESWGCEMTENSCNLAERQRKEFAARCRLWGIQSGEVHLERGDFRGNQQILDTLKRADVILVNNEVFSTELNRNLIDLFLDLKDGCQIISLKSFVDPGHQITKRNIADPANLLRVKTDHYYRNDVSWTDAGGTYFIATKDSSRVKEFEERNR